VDDLNRRRRAVLLRYRIRRTGILTPPLRKLLQQVELLQFRAVVLCPRPDLRRADLRCSVRSDVRSDVRRSGRELLRSGRELLQPVELLPPLELLQEPLVLPPLELLQEPLVLPPLERLLPEELLRSRAQLLRSGRSDLRRAGCSGLRCSDLCCSLQLS
jgi:hypothetical protein